MVRRVLFMLVYNKSNLQLISGVSDEQFIGNDGGGGISKYEDEDGGNHLSSTSYPCCSKQRNQRCSQRLRLRCWEQSQNRAWLRKFRDALVSVPSGARVLLFLTPKRRRRQCSIKTYEL